MNRDDLEKLLTKAEEALRFDLNHIYQQGMGGKLEPASSRDLVAYLKHLSEVKNQQASIDPKDMSDQELEILVKKSLLVLNKEKK